jgi:O-antigen ligase
MWLDNVLTGVGIGQFASNLRFYAPEDLPVRDYRLGAHNMYVQVLAETGIIGFSLFLMMLMSGVRSLWRAARLPNREISALAWTWLLAFSVMLLGGLTKHDQYDKLLWITIGVSCHFDRLARTVLVRVFPIRAASPTGLPRGRRLRGNELYEKQVRRA